MAFTYRIAIEYSPRAGWRGLLDRTLVRQAMPTTRASRLRRRPCTDQELDAGTAAQRPVVVSSLTLPLT